MKLEVGTIYSDPSGDYEILAINKNGVTVKNVDTGVVWEGVSIAEVNYFCKYGLNGNGMEELL